jgi:hypothetical protein
MIGINFDFNFGRAALEWSNIYKFSMCLSANTLFSYFHYEGQPINSAQGNNISLLCESYEIHEWATRCRQYAEFTNVHTGGIYSNQQNRDGAHTKTH